MKKLLTATIAAAALLTAAFAVAPRNWTLRSYDEWLRGKSSGVSLSSEGVLTLAPREDKIEGPAEEFYLAYCPAPDGAAFIGTGHGGGVFRRGKDGKIELYYQTAEMDVTALLLDAQGVLYAATSPQGKIYKITEKDKGAEFFNPAEKYIWDLELESNGNLLAAVGEAGGIYEIASQGQGRMIFKSAENHILCLGRDAAGALLAGSGGPGVVYRIGSGGKGQVLYETPFEEVRALAVGAGGDILAGAGGASKTRKEEPATAVASGQTDVVIAVSAVTGATAAAAAPAGAAPRAAASAAVAGEPGAVYRIAADGSVRKIFSAADEMVYALSWNEPAKRLFIGTGPKGKLYTLDAEENLSLLLQKDAEQIYGLIADGARLHILTNNPPGISALSSEPRTEGEYLSQVFDARTLAAWGRIQWEASIPQGTAVQILSRSGNTAEPTSSWSDWSPPYAKLDGEPMLSPRGRYLQLRALLKIGSGRTAPTLARLTAAYLPANTAPVVGKLDLLPANEVYLKPIDQDEVIWGLERRTPDPPSGKRDEMKFALAKKVERRGYQTAVWEAEDENDDALSYTIWIRAEGEEAWRLLEERWTDCLYSFATTQLPDGIYRLRVAASDLPSNPAGSALTGEKIGPAFLVDNAAPEVKNLRVQRSGGVLSVGFTAEDRFSAVRDVRCLVRPDDWRVVFPEDGISDSRTETFQLKIPLPAAAESLLTIMVRDAAGNTASFKAAF
jgi:hypothetical protein